MYVSEAVSDRSQTNPDALRPRLLQWVALSLAQGRPSRITRATAPAKLEMILEWESSVRRRCRAAHSLQQPADANPAIGLQLGIKRSVFRQQARFTAAPAEDLERHRL
jgi:hypothetical protein